MTARQLATLREALDAMEALHRGDVGTRDEWRARWQRHAKAAMEMREMVERAEHRKPNRKGT